MYMHRHLLYIINPISGSSKNKGSVEETIRMKTTKAGFSFDCYPSVASGDYSFLLPIIAERKVTDVVIAGGDGTVNQVISSLRSQDVQFGIIPCGSGNGLALSAGIPTSLTKALKVIFEGKSEPTDAFMVNQSFACMLCGVGFDAQVAYDFANDPKRGLATYIKQTIKNFFTAKAYIFKVSANKRRFETEAFFISIANSNQFGNNFKIAPQASLTDGMLDIVIMTKQNKLSMLLQAAKQISGLNELQEVEVIDEKSSLLYFQAKKVSIANPGNAPLHVDGDPVETANKITAELLPGCFRLIYPVAK
jgi:YegS/Rv2252/BmrU family lipid kinase